MSVRTDIAGPPSGSGGAGGRGGAWSEQRLHTEGEKGRPGLAHLGWEVLKPQGRAEVSCT